MRGQVPSCPEIAVPPGPVFRLAQALSLGRLLPGGSATRELRSWLAPLLLIAVVGVGGGFLAGGLPAGSAGPATVGLLAMAATLSVIGLSRRSDNLRVAVPALVGVGLCGAGLDWLAEGTGYVVGYMAVVGLALRTPPRVAVLAGSPVVAVIAVEEAVESPNPAATSVAVLSAFGFLFTISEFAAVSLDRRHQAETRLAQEAAAAEAREREAALAERSRLARDLHDVLAHSLSILAVQLETARLTAITTAAGGNLVGQITAAHKLTSIGILNARRTLAMLRNDEPPGPASLPGLVSETAAALGIPIALEVDGVPCALDQDAGLMLYRIVQEALTNVAKHAGRGARVTVRIAWAPGGVEVSVVDSGGDGTDVGLPSGGFGLTSMAERAALKGGRLRAGHSDDGFAVRLWLPAAKPTPAGPTPAGPTPAGPTPGGPTSAEPVSADPAPVRVLVADDQKVVRDGLSLLLGMLPGIEVIGTAVDGTDAVRQAAAAAPDVVLMDLSMPNCDGVEATRLIACEQPDVRVVVLTAFCDDDTVFAALRAGARGYLTKNASAGEILQALSAVRAGDAQMDPSVQRRLLEAVVSGGPPGGPGAPAAGPAGPPDGLTQREVEVLTEIGAGLSNAEIAAKFRISGATVKSHINHLLAKTGARDRAQLVGYAFRHGLAA